MIAGGMSSKKSAESVEILNMENRTSTCSPLPHLSMPSETVVGGLALNEVPLLCSLGSLSSTRCYILINNMWIATDRFSEMRAGASLLSFHFKNSR
jgi:hypothetical protein